MFTTPFNDDDVDTTMHNNSEALKSGHNELGSAIITTTPIVPTAIIAAVNDDRIDHILGDNGQMATPMHIIANGINSDNNVITPEQDLNNGSTISSAKAIITPKKNKHLSKKLLFNFMYPKLTHYPTDLFWTDPSIPTAPIVPPRPTKLAATVNNTMAPVLPPRPTNATTSYTNNDDTTQLS